MVHVSRQFIAQQQQGLPIEIGKHQIWPQLAMRVNFHQRSAPEFETIPKPVHLGIVTCTIHRHRVGFHSQCRGCPKPHRDHRQNAAPRPHIQHELAAVNQVFKPIQQHSCRRVMARAERLLRIEHDLNIS